MSRKNLIIDNPFNTATPFKGLIPQPPFRCVQTADKKISPEKFISVTLTRKDPKIGGSFRSEINRPSDSTPFVEGLIRWYGIRYYFPTAYKFDPSPELIWQQHEYSGNTPPHFALWTEADNLYAVINGKKDKNLGPVVHNKWVPLIFHHKWSKKQEGLIEIFDADGDLLKGYHGPNVPAGQAFIPYLKLGIYKWDWEKHPQNSKTDSRNLYVDQLRIGNEHATFSDVRPDNL